MRRIVTILITAAVLIISCIGVPKPANESDSLILGNVIMDFPDGLFNNPPTTIKDGFTLAFANVTTGEQLKLKTSKGYFSFLCNGKDKYILQYAVGEDPSPGKSFTVGHDLNIKIDPKPNKVIYLGQIKITFAKPELEKVKEGGTEIQSQWRFREDHKIENNMAGLKSFLEDNDADNAWKNREIVSLYAK